MLTYQNNVILRIRRFRFTTKKAWKIAIPLLILDQNLKGSKSIYFILDRLEGNKTISSTVPLSQVQ
jgi:hypothetical protein